MYGGRIVVVCPLPFFNSFFAEVLPEYFRSTEIDIFDRIEPESQGLADSREQAAAHRPFLVLDFQRVMATEDVEEVDHIGLYGKRQALIRAAYKDNPRAESFAKGGLVLDDKTGWATILNELGGPGNPVEGGFSQSWMKAGRDSIIVVKKDVVKPFGFYGSWASKNNVPHYGVVECVSTALFEGDHETIIEKSPELYETGLRHDFSRLASGARATHTYHPQNYASGLKFFQKTIV